MSRPLLFPPTDATRGAASLVHQRCDVLKLHGDYLDNRTKNTEDHLARHDPKMDLYLDLVLDEFGLILCGWSGEWDLRCAARLSGALRAVTQPIGFRAGAALKANLDLRVEIAGHTEDQGQRRLLMSAMGLHGIIVEQAAPNDDKQQDRPHGHSAANYSDL